MGICKVCGKDSHLISDGLGVCLECIRNKPEEALRVTGEAHAASRRSFNLPEFPPRNHAGLVCGGCANDCKIGEGQLGYCGLVINVEGRLLRYGGTHQEAVLEWYYDPLPTNCVAWWFCPGCTGAGYPKYAYTSGPEVGRFNLAVFYGACSYDCLYCQNWHYRRNASLRSPRMSAEELASKVTSDVSCICFFGGDPSPQMPHALKTSEIAIERAAGGILRICWESNGHMRREYARRAAELSLKSGGNIKFDLKSWSESLNMALCGVSNRLALENFEMIGREFFEARAELPLLNASTLLVPGYIDEAEVYSIASFIAGINPRIPYTLLGFCPRFVMGDLPTTRRKTAYACLEAAKRAGLEKIRIGNIHLLH
ncbi:MAG: radical SAM protein [Candidatus Bathyarchaeia archaeon]